MHSPKHQRSRKRMAPDEKEKYVVEAERRRKEFKRKHPTWRQKSTSRKESLPAAASGPRSVGRAAKTPRDDAGEDSDPEGAEARGSGSGGGARDREQLQARPPRPAGGLMFRGAHPELARRGRARPPGRGGAEAQLQAAPSGSGQLQATGRRVRKKPSAESSSSSSSAAAVAGWDPREPGSGSRLPLFRLSTSAAGVVEVADRENRTPVGPQI
eukprot:tig00000545_g1986.t1